MAYRQLKPKQVQEQEATENELTPEQVAAYLRQSSNFQVANNLESGLMQLSGARKFAVSRNLDPDKILIAHEGEGKRGVSGTLRIDQRDVLKEIMAGIYADKIKLVWAYHVNRLFRDRYGVQSGTFIQACAEHNVKVAIETAKIFDFTNQFDVMMFQMLVTVAAKENEDRSNLLHGANAQKAERGQYHGKPLQPGYIIDRNKNSKTYMRYTPYEPHAEVVARLYRRFRELGGQFNVLAAEVGQMHVLFPPFEAWVDQHDVNQFKFKKVCHLHGKLCECKQNDCELAGYHITKPALFRLLTAVEYAGYWKFRGELLTDESGQPLKNHEAIVSMDDWLYAFNRLSFTTLTGEDNPERVSTKTWAPTKKTRPTTLLEGILTSPLGTIWCTDNRYSVTEQQEGKLHRSKTLAVPTLWVDTAFRHRLKQRLYEDLRGHGNFLQEQLKRIKTNNAEALVSVDEQIANYQKAISNREAYIATVGAAIDKETALELNDAMKKDRAQLAALKAKKDAANKEVNGIEELVDQIGRLASRPGKHTFKTKKGEFPTKTGDQFFIADDEETRRFIRLATESVELDKYSGHIFTLTVRWRAPFSQTDVCYIYRQDGGHQAWSDADEQVLHNLYPEADRSTILQALPMRSWKSIVTWANLLGLKRKTTRNTSGIQDANLCWLDAQLLQAHGWKREGTGRQVWWDIGVLDTASARALHLRSERPATRPIRGG